jgi:hypothetical protein
VKDISFWGWNMYIHQALTYGGQTLTYLLWIKYVKSFRRYIQTHRHIDDIPETNFSYSGSEKMYIKFSRTVFSMITLLYHTIYMRKLKDQTLKRWRFGLWCMQCRLQKRCTVFMFLLFAVRSTERPPYLCRHVILSTRFSFVEESVAQRVCKYPNIGSGLGEGGDSVFLLIRFKSPPIFSVSKTSLVNKKGTYNTISLILLENSKGISSF